MRCHSINNISNIQGPIVIINFVTLFKYAQLVYMRTSCINIPKAAACCSNNLYS